MPQLTKHWQIAPQIPDYIEQELLDIQPPLLRQVLFNRGYTTLESAHQYLQAAPPPGCLPEYLLGMEAAVERIQYALSRQESIAIYGDYDADGVTAAVLLVQALRRLGGQAREYIPNRFDEGYGLNIEALDSLIDEGISLVITVDCGIRSPAEVAHARRKGLDVIVTDHHHPSTELPPATAILNPKQPGDTYPDKNLAGVGLAYKLTQALFKEINGDDQTPDNFLDLVALGTVTDMAPLTGENRSLVRRGLESLRRPARQGVLALIGVSGLRPSRLTATDISFALGPRLNAAGRLDTALTAYKLLNLSDPFEAAKLAQELQMQNQERQKVMKAIQAKAEQIAFATEPDPLLLFAADPDFNVGVVGLAASRLCEAYYRPAIIARREEEFTRGSCRSIPELHITAALDQCADLLHHHGGHAAAAGFTVHTDHLPELVERLKAIVASQLSGLVLRPVLKIDAEATLSDLSVELLRELDELQPTGIGNPQALFLSRGVKVLRSNTVGQEGGHLKLVVSDGHITYDAIAFRQGSWHEQMPGYIDIVYAYEINEFNGRQALQLNVRDIRRSASPQNGI